MNCPDLQRLLGLIIVSVSCVAIVPLIMKIIRCWLMGIPEIFLISKTYLNILKKIKNKAVYQR